ncbi:MAG: bis(5'-nucleosyl)-tetraphosphatase (symmetrical) [Betaproteobacteria bacterium TMED82]|nr:MAG: bis(5'-nucleosyl)-tetraphosphatase (symmetrical) [Betaproteobacteria bacterium TMED82]|tara:strand:+ start:37189 stop:37989 length:801 start_codon:yes stop_codon:yes gene_type:complete
MATYAIGDIHGCEKSLIALLEKISPSGNDELWFCGDLVNRGPSSANCIRLIRSLKIKTVCVLGNHDFYLLAAAAKACSPINSPNILSFLKESDKNQMVDWIRQQPLAHVRDKTILVHAGIFPAWDINSITSLSEEVSKNLKSDSWKQFISELWGDYPNYWNDNLKGSERFRAIVNGFTRIRFITPDEKLNYSEKGAPSEAEAPLIPWFSHKKLADLKYRFVFGHWSRLGLLVRPKLLALDTGCVWGGYLTAARLEDNKIFTQQFVD